MLQRFLVFIFLISLNGALFGQDKSLIKVDSRWYQQSFTSDSASYTLAELIPLFSASPQADALIRSANNRHDFSSFCQISGVFLVLYPLLNNAIGGQSNSNISYIGIGLLGLSVPIEISSRRKANAAVISYNQFRQAPIRVDLKIGVNGIGLNLRF
jgi:hypothetical protein